MKNQKQKKEPVVGSSVRVIGTYVTIFKSVPASTRPTSTLNNKGQNSSIKYQKSSPKSRAK